MHIFVISLAKSQLRRKFIKSQFQKAKIDFEFFDAIDGDDIENNLVSQYFDREEINRDIKKFNKGSISCTISHFKLFEKIINENIRYACVLEDDIKIQESFYSILNEINLYSGNDELILLHYKQKKTIHLSKRQQLSPNIFLCDFLSFTNQIHSSSAYIISNSICKNIIQNSLPLNSIIDDWKHFFDKKCFLTISCIHQYIVKDAFFKSTITIHEPRKMQFFHNFLFMIENLRIPIAKDILSILRQIQYRNLTRVRYD